MEECTIFTNLPKMFLHLFIVLCSPVVCILNKWRNSYQEKRFFSSLPLTNRIRGQTNRENRSKDKMLATQRHLFLRLRKCCIISSPPYASIACIRTSLNMPSMHMFSKCSEIWVLVVAFTLRQFYSV